MLGLLLVLQVATANTVYDRVILGGRVMDQRSSSSSERRTSMRGIASEVPASESTMASASATSAQRLEARVPAMKQKGRLGVGADADITIFDAGRVVDRSTYREPSLPPVGIQHVIVNGVPVVANGRAVDSVAPGKAVRAPSGASAAKSPDGMDR